MDIKTLLATAIILLVFFVGKKSISSLVNRIGSERAVAPARVHYVKTVLGVVWTIVAVSALVMFVGIGYHDLGVFFGSVFAVIGIALFAQWSILSNITASVIVFFFFPYRVGHTVTIIDGENSISGVISEITLFHVILHGENGDVLTFPNAMAFQKSVRIQSPQTKPEDT